MRTNVDAPHESLVGASVARAALTKVRLRIFIYQLTGDRSIVLLGAAARQNYRPGQRLWRPTQPLIFPVASSANEGDGSVGDQEKERKR